MVFKKFSSVIKAHIVTGVLLLVSHLFIPEIIDVANGDTYLMIPTQALAQIGALLFMLFAFFIELTKDRNRSVNSSLSWLHYALTVFSLILCALYLLYGLPSYYTPTETATNALIEQSSPHPPALVISFSLFIAAQLLFVSHLLFAKKTNANT